MNPICDSATRVLLRSQSGENGNPRAFSLSPCRKNSSNSCMVHLSGKNIARSIGQLGIFKRSRSSRKRELWRRGNFLQRNGTRSEEISIARVRTREILSRTKTTRLRVIYGHMCRCVWMLGDIGLLTRKWENILIVALGNRRKLLNIKCFYGFQWEQLLSSRRYSTRNYRSSRDRITVYSNANCTPRELFATVAQFLRI